MPTPAVTGAADASSPDRRAVAAVIVVVAAIVAWFGYRQAVTDWTYQLAGLADPFLGRPAPGMTIALLAIASVVVALVWSIIRERSDRQRPSSPASAPDGQRWRPTVRWWWILVAAWAGYALGAVMMVAAGGPVDHPGSMRLAFGAPINSEIAVDATCRSAPGKPSVVTQVIPDVGSAPRIDLRNAATGELRPWPAGSGVSLEHTAWNGSSMVIPGIPDRPPMYQIGWGVDGPLYGPPRPFLAAYLYPVTRVDDRGASGTLTAAAQREHGLGMVNDLVPDDPWPESYELEIAWACDVGATKPVSMPTATLPPESSRPPAPSPSGLDPDRIPVRVQLATTSTMLAVEIGGATIVEGSLVSSDGVGVRATVTGQALTVRQPAAGVDRGRTVGATFDLVLAGLSPGSELTILLRQGSDGVGAVTFWNALGQVPLPVAVIASQPQPVSAGTQASIPATWLASPISAPVDPGA